MEPLSEALGGLIIVSGAVLIVYFIAKYNYLLKKMLAEKGIKEPSIASRIDKLDIAYIVMGIGVGLLISALLSILNLPEDTLDLLSWGVILICGAVGLILTTLRKK